MKTKKRPLRPLGENQLSCLRSMIEHSPTGTWRAGCGWIWGSVSETVRLMDSLVRRGLATRHERGRDMYPEFRITRAGVEVVSADWAATSKAPMWPTLREHVEAFLGTADADERGDEG